MSKTVAGLVAFAKSKLGTPYIYGAKGTVMSLSQIRALRKQYGSNCVWTSDDSKAGKVCVDCSGLISWSAASNLISEFLVNPVFARGLEIFYCVYGAQMGQTIKFLTPLAVRFAYFLISL